IPRVTSPSPVSKTVPPRLNSQPPPPIKKSKRAPDLIFLIRFLDPFLTLFNPAHQPFPDPDFNAAMLFDFLRVAQHIAIRFKNQFRRFSGFVLNRGICPRLKYVRYIVTDYALHFLLQFAFEYRIFATFPHGFTMYSAHVRDILDRLFAAILPVNLRLREPFNRHIMASVKAHHPASFRI